jgi:hypothetical protein
VLERNNVNLQQYKALFIVVTAVLSLLVVSPALARVLVYPQTSFSPRFGCLVLITWLRTTRIT